MKQNENEYFDQITVAFLSSRIQETEAKLLVLLGRGWNVGVNVCRDRGCVRIGGQVGMQFQIGSGYGLGWNLVVCV